MALDVRSISWSSEPSRWPSLPAMSSRWRQVTASMRRASADDRNASDCTWPRSALCESRRYRSRPPAARVAATRSRIPKPSRLWTRSCSRSVRSAARASNARLVRLGHGAAERGDLGKRLGHRRAARDQYLARPQDAQLVGQRLRCRWRPRIRRRETRRWRDRAGPRRTPSTRPVRVRARARGDDRHQEQRLARVQIGAVGQRAGRHHADDLAAHQPLGLLGVLHLLADGDPESLAHELGDVAVGGVERDAAHRHALAAGVLGPRRQREIEGARADDRVLVEHLVEVAHAEEDEGSRVLPLGFEVLPHGRSDGVHRGRRMPGGALGIAIIA